MPAEYDFTKDWFSSKAPIWEQILERYPPRRVLEVGSYEGRSTVFLVEACAKVGPLDLYCIDSWAGGVEHDPAVMGAVEARFDANLAVAMAAVAPQRVRLTKHKARSIAALSRLVAEGAVESFDLVYVDGSHQAPDVLADAVLSFELTRVGGVMIFDDYLWSQQEPGHEDSFDMPKPAIDAFINLYQRKLRVMRAPLDQLYVQKTAS